MSIFKCKMCGGTIEFEQGATVGVCDSCGTKQTLPRLDNDKKANLYDRANHFRRNNDFDKAMSIYEQILNEDGTDAEAYWSLVLCRYGIEYVEDPTSHKRIPTVNRAQFTSIYMDEDYKSALQYADGYQKQIYEEEAKAIDDIQKGILEISAKEEPFDIFICYKETDANGRRTQDSVLANDLYHQLTQEGFKVFFARITLEDKLGVAYEPYIFAALNSSKVMVVVGTKPEYFNAVWVKNEWSRYLALIKNGAKKILIPAYRDMDPYDLPEEFSHLQAQDMSKLGFMQDLIRGIKKIVQVDESRNSIKETIIPNANAANISPLLERAYMFLEDSKWQEADSYCEKVLDINPKNAEAYLGKLMAELRVTIRKSLADCAEPFDDKDNYNKVLRFGDENLIKEMQGYIKHINERNEDYRLNSTYDKAVSLMKEANSEGKYKAAANFFESISGFKDADELAKECLDKAEVCRKDAIYSLAKSQMVGEREDTYEKAIEIFETISGWKDSDELVSVCKKKIYEIEAQEEAERLEAERKAEEKRIAAEKQVKKINQGFAIGAVVAILFIIFLSIWTSVIIPMQKMKEVRKLVDSGEYDSAYELLEEMGKSEEFVSIKYDSAVKFMDSGKYDKVLNLLIGLSYKDSDQLIEKCYIGKYGEEKWNKIKSIEIGDTFAFGSYEQDNDEANGKEPIEWIVLDKDGGSLLLISKQILDWRKYNSSDIDVTWETCSLRKWINDGFFNSAFSQAEQAMIMDTTVRADKNPNYKTDPGKTTTDKVFILSSNEVEEYSNYLNQVIPTEYAVANGCIDTIDFQICFWWLRTPGTSKDYATGVFGDKTVRYYGYRVNNIRGGIRPALWLDLENYIFE